MRGFTLIELSIVLVIIGLIVGGVLVGQDLIRAAAVRATIAQIEKYNAAANTFRGKYGYLPGDIKNPEATQFGLVARGQYAGEGDGNGVIEGVDLNNNTSNWGNAEDAGETVMFWVDLSTVHLIDGGFNTASPSVLPATLTGVTLNLYFPTAKIGQGNYVYVWSGGFALGYSPDGNNYFGLSAISAVTNPGSDLTSTAALTVQQAYNMDKKLDDGLPQTGRVTAMYLTGANPIWAAGGGSQGIWPQNAAPASAISCYDNGNNANNTMQYSVEVNNGSGMNCALTFQFQ